MRSSESIRRNLLRITPIGSSMEDVIRIAYENDDWTIRRVSEDYGVFFWPNSSRPSSCIPGENCTIVGDQSIQIYLGHTTFGVYVSAFYSFDENGVLIDIFIRRDWS